MRALFTIFFTLFLIIGYSQSISFAEPEELFIHPMIYNGSFSGPITHNPFVPTDFNNDGLTDFIGSGRVSLGDRYFYFLEATSENSFMVDSISTGFDDPIFAQVADLDKDGSDDILVDKGFLLSGSKELQSIPIPETYDQQNTFESYLGVYDFNGDGKLDYLIKREFVGERPHLSVYLSNESDDNFDDVVFSEFGPTDFADFEVVDINKDGHLDIVTTPFSGDGGIGSIYIHYNNGAGDLSESQRISGSRNDFYASIFSNLEVQDLDNDGNLDIIFVDEFDGIFILKNSGTGNENEIDFEVEDHNIPAELSYNGFESLPITYVLGDLNNDGLQDLVVLAGLGTLFYIENEGGFSFSDPLSLGKIDRPSYIYGAPGSGVISPELSKLIHNLNLYDYDSDGDLDVLLLDGDETGRQLLYRNGPKVEEEEMEEEEMEEEEMEEEEMEEEEEEVDGEVRLRIVNEPWRFLLITTPETINSVNITDPSGDIIAEHEVNLNVASINLESISAGTYTINTFTDQGKISREVIID